MAVSVSVDGAELVVEMAGADVVWSLRRRVSVPRNAVVDVHLEPEPRRLRLGLRWPGAYFPGVITAGMFYGKGGKTFANVRRGPAVAIDLAGSKLDRIIVQVPDAQAVARRLRAELGLQ